MTWARQCQGTHVPLSGGSNSLGRELPPSRAHNTMRQARSPGVRTTGASCVCPLYPPLHSRNHGSPRSVRHLPCHSILTHYPHSFPSLVLSLLPSPESSLTGPFVLHSFTEHNSFSKLILDPPTPALPPSLLPAWPPPDSPFSSASTARALAACAASLCSSVTSLEASPIWRGRDEGGGGGEGEMGREKGGRGGRKGKERG